MIDGLGDPLQRLLIGASEPMRRLRSDISRVAVSRLPALIEGPTGAGKELVARALHAASGRVGELVAVNVCAIGESMFEDALFGHAKGAFTGAASDTLGYLAEANGGSLFLDEINGLPLAGQSKLLRVLETGVFRQLGARRDRCSDFRVIAATNDDLRLLVGSGRFRSDLLFRLSGVVLRVPSLRERLEDLETLVNYFLRRSGSDVAYVVAPDAMRRLERHAWGGNVRELKHVVERLSLVAVRGHVTRSDVEFALQGSGECECSIDWRLAARQELLAILRDSEWDTALTASRMGVHRATVYRQMKQLGIEVPTSFPSRRGHARPSSTIPPG